MKYRDGTLLCDPECKHLSPKEWEQEAATDAVRYHECLEGVDSCRLRHGWFYPLIVSKVGCPRVIEIAEKDRFPG